MSAAPLIERSEGRLKLGGELRMPDATRLWDELHALAAEAPDSHLDIDLSGASVIDGAVIAMLFEFRGELAARGVRSEIVGAPAPLEPIVELYRADGIRPPEPARPAAPLVRIGAAMERGGGALRRSLTFAGEQIGVVPMLLRRPRSLNWKSIPVLLERAGADGLPIVLLLNFLVGFVMAFQSAPQLRAYGANLFVADIVGISVTRELAPLMTAIIMSGRSGASYAAELGTMRVSEEIDALRTMGIPPAAFLVIPRVIALALVAPALTILGDIVGIAGGIVVGVTKLGVSPRGYLMELQSVITLSDVWSGLIKSVVFGLSIALIGCQQGLSTRGAAAGVGRSTASTVVRCLFTIIVIDTIATVLLRRFGA